jgi:hypothetical protein
MISAGNNQAKNACQRLRKHGLSQSRQVLDQQVSTSKQTRQRQCNLVVLAEDDPAECIACSRDSSTLRIPAIVQLFQRISLLHCLVLEI